MELLYTLLVGGIAGWLAGTLIRGGSFGIVLNIIVGIIGAFIGNWLLPILNISFEFAPFVNEVLEATIGAGVLLIAIRFLR